MIALSHVSKGTKRVLYPSLRNLKFSVTVSTEQAPYSLGIQGDRSLHLRVGYCMHKLKVQNLSFRLTHYIDYWRRDFVTLFNRLPALCQNERGIGKSTRSAQRTDKRPD